jgi:hypothetical protein
MGPTLEGMTVTVNLPDDAARRLAAEAARRGITVDEVIAELAATLPTGAPRAAERSGKRRLEFMGMGASGDPVAGHPEPARERFRFIGMGHSGADGGDIGRRHEEILREHFANKTARDV